MGPVGSVASVKVKMLHRSLKDTIAESEVIRRLINPALNLGFSHPLMVEQEQQAELAGRSRQQRVDASVGPQQDVNVIEQGSSGGVTARDHPGIKRFYKLDLLDRTAKFGRLKLLSMEVWSLSHDLLGALDVGTGKEGGGSPGRGRSAHIPLACISSPSHSPPLSSPSNPPPHLFSCPPPPSPFLPPLSTFRSAPTAPRCAPTARSTRSPSALSCSASSMPSSPRISRCTRSCVCWIPGQRGCAA